jgi:hypothetical protein
MVYLIRFVGWSRRFLHNVVRLVAGAVSDNADFVMTARSFTCMPVRRTQCACTDKHVHRAAQLRHEVQGGKGRFPETGYSAPRSTLAESNGVNG